MSRQTVCHCLAIPPHATEKLKHVCLTQRYEPIMLDWCKSNTRFALLKFFPSFLISLFTLNAILICSSALWVFTNDFLLAILNIYFILCIPKEKVQFFSMALSGHTSRTGLRSSCLIHHSYLVISQQTAISSNILITFFREKKFHNQQDREITFQELLNHEALTKKYLSVAFIYLE